VRTTLCEAREFGELTGAVAQPLHRHAHLVEQRQLQVGERRVLRIAVPRPRSTVRREMAFFSAIIETTERWRRRPRCWRSRY
jgi:hypothetical protein